MIDMNELFLREEPLCEELLDYVVDGPVGKMIHHPLHVSITYSETHCAIINESFRRKKEALDEAIRDENYHTVIMLHERPYRYDALIDMINGYGLEQHEDYWSVVGHAWIDSENIYQNSDGWRDIWHSDAENREQVMTDDERAFLASLPATIKVYRGVQEGGTDMGMSWTLDRKKAQWFADRYRGNGYVLGRRVSKKKVLAYFDRRAESEIVVFPEDLR